MSDPTEFNPTLSAAYEYARNGWSVIPLYAVLSDGTCACEKSDCESPGKHPTYMRWYDRASAAGPEITEWFEAPGHNIGIVTGEKSGIWVLDIDPDNGGDVSLRALEEEHGRLPTTRVARTGSGGYHFYWKRPEGGVRSSLSRVGPGIDVKADGGHQVVAPPSVTDKGAYEIVNDEPVAEAPEWLLELAAPPTRTLVTPEGAVRLAEAPPGYVDRVISEEVAAFARAEEGTRNHQLNLHAFKVATLLPHEVLTEGQIREAFTPVATSMGLTPVEVDRTLTSAIRGGLSKPRSWPPVDRTAGLIFEYDEPEAPAVKRQEWNDFGNALRLLDHHPDRLLWLDEAQRWAVYDYGLWRLDKTRMGQQLCQRMINALPRTEALLYSDEKGPKGGDSEREKFVAWVQSQKRVGPVKAALETLKGGRGMSVEITNFDQKPFLLGVGGGKVVDLETAEARDAVAGDMLMSQVDVDWDPDAQCPQWEQFLKRVQPDVEVRAFLQQVLGYSLTGDISEQKFFIHLGEGANGKSVTMEVVQSVLGSYAQSIPRSTLVLTKNESIPTDVARMSGKRFLQASESAKGQVLDEEKIRSLTGGDKQAARFMRQDFFDFDPTGKLHLTTNHFPKVSEAPSTWRRLVIFKWLVVIPEEERDLTLAQRIIAEEGPGVLQWLLRGLQGWMDNDRRLQIPEQVREWAREYRDDSDEFAEFIEECLVVREDLGFHSAASMYSEHRLWAERGGRPVISVKAFSSAMKERGFEPKRGRANGVECRGFVGVAPRAAWMAEDPPDL